MTENHAGQLVEFFASGLANAGLAGPIRPEQRLDRDQALTLAQIDSLPVLAYWADRMRSQRVGPQVYYRLNRHINFTNVCRNACGFCHFAREPQDDTAYTLTIEQIRTEIVQAVADGAHDIHLVGGVNQELGLDYYVDMVRIARQVGPNLFIKALTATEVVALADREQMGVEQVLAELQRVGLDSLTGGGAEILDDQYFAEHCSHKATPNQWCQVHQVAHRLGLMSTATMLVGFGETAAQRVDHLLRIRDLQDRSLAAGRGSFMGFVPLPYVPAEPAAMIDAGLILRTIALSRLVLDNFDCIKSFWPMLGVNLATVALRCGANDLDGTVGNYQIVSPSRDSKGLTEEQIGQIVRAVGLEACRA